MLLICKLLVKYILIVLSNILIMPCSYCSRSGHTIVNCDCPSINIWYRRFLAEYTTVVRLYSNNRYEFERRFKDRLNRMYNLRELRVVAIRYTSSARTTHNKGEIIHLLWIHFIYEVGLGVQPQQQQQQWIMPSTPDRIPTFAQDLDANFNGEDDDEGILTWIIDRNPELLDAYRGEIEFINFLRQVTANNTFTSRVERKFRIVIDLVEEGIREGEEGKEGEEGLGVEAEEVDDCPICYEEVSNKNEVKLNCNHIFCCACIKHSLKSYDRQTCALCRTPTTSYSVKNTDVYNVVAEHCIN